MNRTEDARTTVRRCGCRRYPANAAGMGREGAQNPDPNADNKLFGNKLNGGIWVGVGSKYPKRMIYIKGSTMPTTCRINHTDGRNTRRALAYPKWKASGALLPKTCFRSPHEVNLSLRHRRLMRYLSLHQRRECRVEGG